MCFEEVPPELPWESEWKQDGKKQLDVFYHLLMEKEKKEGTLPIVCGAVHEGDIHLVILKWQGQTATCAAGEWWNGWYIAYVNRQAAGLQRDGRVFEIPL